MEYDDLECEPMDTSDSPWNWFYEAECGIWHRIEDDPVNFPSSSELERYYLNNSQGVLDITTSGGHFRINFSACLQTNLTTGQTRQIQRSSSTVYALRCKCADQAQSVPAHWENVDPMKPYQAIHVRVHTNEFKEVEKYVLEIGLLQKPIRNIYRIQNVDLWELYHRKRVQLMRIKGQSHIEEQRLFHGTSRDNVDTICKYNFDSKLSDRRRKAHVYGKGTYFAKYASYADKYSCKVKNALQVMFLARVTVGKYKKGERDLCKPDGDLKENIHDSCVDDEMCPNIFAIFDSNQIYPEYLLEYAFHKIVDCFCGNLCPFILQSLYDSGLRSQFQFISKVLDGVEVGALCGQSSSSTPNSFNHVFNRPWFVQWDTVMQE